MAAAMLKFLVVGLTSRTLLARRGYQSRGTHGHLSFETQELGATCEEYFGCQLLDGDCCPNADGVMLDCCAIPEPPLPPPIPVSDPLPSILERYKEARNSEDGSARRSATRELKELSTPLLTVATTQYSNSADEAEIEFTRLALQILSQRNMFGGPKTSPEIPAADLSEIPEKTGDVVDDLLIDFRQAMRKPSEMFKQVGIAKVKSAIGRLDIEVLSDAVTRYANQKDSEEHEFVALLNIKLTALEKEAAETAEALKHLGASAEQRELSRQREKAKWKVPCETGVKINFVKISSFSESLAQLMEPKLDQGYDANETVLAFDLDGTLAYMRDNDGEATLAALKGQAKDAAKLVITARTKSYGSELRYHKCDQVLHEMRRGATGDQFQEVFGWPEKCTKDNAAWPVLKANGTAEEDDMMMSVPGLVMNEYNKEQGIVTYLQSVSPGKPKHVIFFDDYVLNPMTFARHFCRQEKWEGLEQVTSVWFATPEAEKTNRLTEERMRKGIIDLGSHSESSHFSPVAEEDARLAGARGLFDAPIVHPASAAPGAATPSAPPGQDCAAMVPVSELESIKGAPAVQSATPGELRNVMCGLGRRPAAGSVQCGVDGKFDPEPECFEVKDFFWPLTDVTGIAKTKERKSWGWSQRTRCCCDATHSRVHIFTKAEHTGRCQIFSNISERWKRGSTCKDQPVPAWAASKKPLVHYSNVKGLFAKKCRVSEKEALLMNDSAWR